MKEFHSRAGLKLTAVMLAALLLLAGSGCGGNADGEAKIALLLSERQTPRYESVDRPVFEEKVKEICSDCRIVYRNMAPDAFEQRRQVSTALKQAPDVLVLDPADPSFAAIVKKVRGQGVPLLDYDQLIVNAQPDAYVSYDRVEVGERIAEMLAEKLKKEGSPRGPIVFMNGEPGANEQHWYEQGARSGFKASGVEFAKQYDTPFSEARYAKEEMREAIAALGADGFTGVYAETDEVARGAIAAMKSAGINPEDRPSTGRDATVAGVRRILAGEQYMTIFEPAEAEAELAAEIAVELGSGNDLRDRLTDELQNSNAKVPAILLQPVAVTKANVEQTVIADGLISPVKLCADGYESACTAAGVSPKARDGSSVSPHEE